MDAMHYLYQLIHHLFLFYTILLFLYVFSSWFPSWQRMKFFRFISFYAEPYLSIFRRILPPIGGVLDLSPLFAFLGLRILESMLLGILR